MNLLSELNNSSNSVEDLENFINDNFNKLYDFLSLLNHNDLTKHRKEFKSILLKINTIGEIEFSKSTNVSFVNLLLNASIRLGERLFFQRLFDLMAEKNIQINTIAKASALYLTNVNNADDFLDKYSDILAKLEFAYLNEEDNEDTALASLFNYYALFVMDFCQFAQDKVVQLRDKIWSSYTNKTYHFIENALIEELYYTDLDFYSNPYATLQNILDNFLGRDRAIADFDERDFIIESGSEYANLLSKEDYNFAKIRSINSRFYLKIKSDEIYYSLLHGVKILDKEEQLFGYIYSYGNMHNEKLLSAYEHLPKPFFKNKINIFDWACGQGIGAMSYLDFLETNLIDQNINNICLIDPSTIALKRASLHINKYSININTINKDFDSLRDRDFRRDSKEINLHLLSNILDIELFSLEKFIILFKDNFPGENFFVITSPYIDDIRTSRINSFVNHYKNNIGFEEFAAIYDRKGDWKNGWSRVVRVFKVII